MEVKSNTQAQCLPTGISSGEPLTYFMKNPTLTVTCVLRSDRSGSSHLK